MTRSPTAEAEEPLRRTALHPLHIAHGARLGEFAGFEMPLTFAGAVAEHLHTRTSCSLFDVSHMLVCDVLGPGITASIEHLTPSRLTDLPEGRSRYLVLTNDGGGVIDDSVVTARTDGFRFVFNASRSRVDVDHFRQHLGDAVRPRSDLGIVALQGPKAADVLERHGVETGDLAFMHSKAASLAGVGVEVSRSGYTGEDGFEITASVARLPDLAATLLADEAVEPAGLAARDSLRLEAGLCLYGNDLDEETTPVEAGLVWTIAKARREIGGFLGAPRILEQLRDGVVRRRVGIRPEGRRPVRQGAVLRSMEGIEVGYVSSGSWGATVDGPVAMGYVVTALSRFGSRLEADVRGTGVPCEVVRLPFVPSRYVKARQ